MRYDTSHEESSGSDRHAAAQEGDPPTGEEIYFQIGVQLLVALLAGLIFGILFSGT